MIRPITEIDLPECLEIFHRGYETVAVEFGLTEENCPDRGRASLPYQTLLADYKSGTSMYGYFHDEKPIGFLGIKMEDGNICNLNDIIVLPEYRGNRHGKELLDFCIKKARELGAEKITLGMIDDNTRLRKWYENKGFINIGYRKYESAPFTIGKMEYRL